jgi:hypothetical protein
MNEKIICASGTAILLIIALTFAASLFFPPYASQALVAVYRSALLAAAVLFVVRQILLKRQLAQTPLDLNLFLLLCWSTVSSLFSKSMFNSLISTASFALFVLFYYLVFNYAKKFYKSFSFFISFIKFFFFILDK